MKRLIHPTKQARRQFRHARVRARVRGTSACPRLSVFRSLRHLQVQLIDDERGVTLVAVSTRQVTPGPVANKSGKVALAYLVGQLLGAKAKALNIDRAVFDRGGYRYHGRVAAAAEGAREAGLKV